MSYTEVLDVKKWLNAQHILVPIEWVESCVDFLREEYNNPNMPLQQLKNHVYKQWLVADLEEIGVPALPPDLCAIQKIVLPNCYVLQVNGLRDIGKPSYSQLRQLEGSLNADSEVSAAPKAFQPEWEVKPTRMLFLNLTDGVSFIQGMEYKPISELSLNLPPGVKILVKGPVDCRLGIIMLTQDKVKVLGGEVESHLQKYSREEMLRENLQLNTGDDITTDSELVDLQNDDTNSDNTFSTNHIQDNRAPSFLSRRNPIDVNQNMHREGHMQATNPILSNREIDINDFEENDDFPDDIDHNALDEIERISSQQISSHNDDHQEVSEDEEMLRDAYAFQDQVDFLPDNVLYGESKLSPPDDPILPYQDILSKAPFTYLISVNENGEKNVEHSITIKGFISKVLTRLSCTASKEWQLSAKINDGTACMEVNFHDKVLEEFIGISAKDTVEMQIRSPGDAQVKQKIAEAVGGCKQKLQDLNCLMGIRFVPGQLPCVMKCTQIEKSHMEQLLKRIQA